jgi:hypothetical protein
MDTIGGKNVLYFPKNDIKSTLINDPSLLKDKKFMELFTGYLVAEALEKETNIGFEVGFPLKKVTRSKHPQKGPSLKEVIKNPDIVDDSDADICLGNENSLFFCQITRLVVKIRESGIADELFALLEKKFLIQPDDSLILILNIEEDVSINIDRLYDFFDSKKVPYGFIFMVGKREQSRGMFQCHQLYPGIKEPVCFHIGIHL